MSSPAPTSRRQSPALIIGDVTFAVELPLTPEARGRGLSGRDSLEPRTGMFFLLAPTIWMKGMRIPLDLVWISRQCTIAQIDADVPPPEPGTPDAELPRYSSGATAAHVLEINGGEAQMHGIMVGDSVTFVGIEAEAGGLCE